MDGCLLLDPRRIEVEDGGLEYPGDDAYRRHISATGGRHFPATPHPPSFFGANLGARIFAS